MTDRYFRVKNVYSRIIRYYAVSRATRFYLFIYTCTLCFHLKAGSFRCLEIQIPKAGWGVGTLIAMLSVPGVLLNAIFSRQFQLLSINVCRDRLGAVKLVY